MPKVVVNGYVQDVAKMVLLTVPSRTYRPDADETGRAVVAVRDVRNACSMVPGRPPPVLPGRSTPLSGRPNDDRGLYI